LLDSLLQEKKINFFGWKEKPKKTNSKW